MHYQSIKLTFEGDAVARLTLARPDMQNALSLDVVAELRHALQVVAQKEQVRALVLTGEGKTFCAGGDLNWMKTVLSQSRAQRIADSRPLADLFYEFDNLPKVVIGRINGPAYGGGVGMISVCDIAIGVDTGIYSLSETRLGLLPANIAPYVVARMGEANARRTFLTAQRMGGAEARSLGLLSDVVSADELDAAVEREIADLLQCAPGAVAATKKPIAYVAAHDLDTNMIYTADKLADAWETDEGREGITAFFAKRAPFWRRG
jgi:methylglutaconyl-CoA hydratase